LVPELQKIHYNLIDCNNYQVIMVESNKSSGEIGQNVGRENATDARGVLAVESNKSETMKRIIQEE